MTERLEPYSLRTVEGVIYLLYPTGETTGLKWEEKDAAQAQAELARYNSTPRATITDQERAYLAAHPDDQGALPEGQEPVQPREPDPRAAAFDAKYNRRPKTPPGDPAALDMVNAGILDSLARQCVNVVPDDLDVLVEVGQSVLREFGVRGLQKVINAAKTKAKELEQS